MSKGFLSFLMASCMAIGVVGGVKIGEVKKGIEVKNEVVEVVSNQRLSIATESTQHKDLKEIAQKKGLKQFDRIIEEFSNGSIGIKYPELDRYYFTPYEMGDWDYEFTNEEQYKNAINTYMSMKNNGTY